MLLAFTFSGMFASGGEGLYAGHDAQSNPLRVKGAVGRGRKKRKVDSENNSDGLGGNGAGLEAMQELLGGLPRPSKEGASSSAGDFWNSA
ncbi:hypothetical protein HAX54_018520 [Datura stramonium]|uniref:Uncharacterized protein n=1 Tax=Datura stramonium TaxID=4076 RepID=A0ABS8UMF5_DATST|nr:hypothetical protein [Datura stramonium]